MSKERIENAIRHIQTATDIDPWAMEIAVDAMQRMMNADGDLISRQAAMDALKRISFSHWFECGEYLSEDIREIEIINSKKALEVIEALPSAQHERKKGRWIGTVEDWRNQIVWWGCSECGMDVSTRYNFCPNCGAEMRGEEDG